MLHSSTLFRAARAPRPSQQLFPRVEGRSNSTHRVGSYNRTSPLCRRRPGVQCAVDAVFVSAAQEEKDASHKSPRTTVNLNNPSKQPFASSSAHSSKPFFQTALKSRIAFPPLTSELSFVTPPTPATGWQVRSTAGQTPWPLQPWPDNFWGCEPNPARLTSLCPTSATGGALGIRLGSCGVVGTS